MLRLHLLGKVASIYSESALNYLNTKLEYLQRINHPCKPTYPQRIAILKASHFVHQYVRTVTLETALSQRERLSKKNFKTNTIIILAHVHGEYNNPCHKSLVKASVKQLEQVCKASIVRIPL